MIDVLYLLGKGSKHDNLEIRYSLRSLEKYVTGIRNVYIIGELPKFIKNVIHIPFREKSRRASKNIPAKLLLACSLPELSKEFLFVNDDHFFLSGFVAKDYPYYHRGDLYDLVIHRKNKTPYTELMAATYIALYDKKMPTLDFDVHTPIVFNKEIFTQVMNKFEAGKKRFVLKSLYCNANKITGVKIQDCKFSQPHTVDYLKENISGRDCFSISVTVHESYKQLLQELYPNPSKYEA